MHNDAKLIEWVVFHMADPLYLYFQMLSRVSEIRVHVVQFMFHE